MSDSTTQTSEGAGSPFHCLSQAVTVVAIASLLAGIYLWWIDDEVTLALIAFLPFVSVALAQPVRFYLTRWTAQQPWLLAVWFAVAIGLILVDWGLWQDAQKRISITRVEIVTESPECQLEISGRYNLYTLACDQPNDCVPFVLFKTAGVDGYYHRVELSDKLKERRGNWSVRIDVLASSTITETKEQGWCRNPVFDPQKPFDVYVALAPQGWWNKFMDCMPANQGLRTNDPPVQGLDFLSEGIRKSCANR
jgi:hypothetical protein